MPMPAALSRPPLPSTQLPSTQPLLLRQAVEAYLRTLAPDALGSAEGRLRGLEAFLGVPAPLLAYTRLTGEAWVRSLPATEWSGARGELAAFRAFLRDHGWLDAARPVNVLD